TLLFRMSLEVDNSLADQFGGVSLDTSLLDLPDEIIEMIISHLNFADQSRIRVNKRLRKIEERIEDRGEGSKEEFKTLDDVTSSSKFELSVNEGKVSEHSISTVATVIRRLNNRIHDLTIYVNPHEISHLSLLEVLCENTNKEVYILSYDEQSVVSPLTSKLDLSILIRLIRNCTELYINFASSSLTVDDIIELNKVSLRLQFN
ncbi:hypothetical protein PFISCL1PPCAC_18970, partial [Pristionchus fissidentatus]